MRAYYRVTQSAQNNAVACTELPWKAPPPAKTTASTVLLTTAGQAFLVDYAASSGKAAMSELTNDKPPKAAKTFDLKAGWDALDGFLLGNVPYLMTYKPGAKGSDPSGLFSFVPFGQSLTPGTPFPFKRPHEPGITAGFTTVKMLVTPTNTVYLFGYNEATGHVATYTVSVTESGDPPLLIKAVWSHTWATGWTRFAFFRFAGETFFLKTNVKYPNVNIDHVFDDLTQDTLEVVTNMQDKLPNALDLTICQSFTLENGEPHFVAYQKDGTARFYRFWGNGQGWTPVLKTKLAAGATQILATPQGASSLLILT